MPIVIDARQMQPPEPFERVMESLDRLGSDDEIVLLLGREPTPLYRVLSRNGFRHEVVWTDAGHCEIHIRHAVASP